MKGILLLNKHLLNTVKQGLAIGLLTLFSHNGYPQIIKSIGVSTGVNFSSLRWEYRYSGNDPITIRRSERQPAGFNLYLTTNIIDKQIWNINSSLGWIRKRGMFTESSSLSASVPYTLDYISWTSSIKGKLPLGKHFSFHAALGPRLEYLLTPWNEIPSFAPNDDTFFYYHRSEDLNRFTIGLTGGVGLTWRIEKVMLQLLAWKNLDPMPIISAHGPREDGLGDEDFYFEMRDRTYGMNLQFMFSL